MFLTQDDVDRLQAMGERRKQYQPRQFENSNQQAVEGHLISMLVFMGEKGAGAYNKLILDKGEWFVGRKPAKNYPVCANYKKRRPRPFFKEGEDGIACRY